MPPSSFAMLERYLHDIRTDDPGLEDPAATRDRLRASFAPGATRRMSQLGLLVGSVLGPLEPQEDDALVYATGYGESRALEGYLESFPFPSPTLFQTSIHPGGVQQGLIGRQRSVRELIPISAGNTLSANALLVAMLSPARRVVLCGGEERGTWLLEQGVASDRAFAFALALSREPAGAVARIALVQDRTGTVDDGALPLAAFFELLHHRRAHSGAIAAGWSMDLTWS
jgi:hypothetical protein